MNLSELLTHEKLWLMFSHSRDSELQDDVKALAGRLGKDVSTVRRWINGYRETPEGRIFKRDNHQTCLRILECFGISERDHDKLLLNGADFLEWYTQENCLNVEVAVGFDAIMDVMSEMVKSASAYIWLYSANGSDVEQEKRMLDLIDHKLHQADGTLQLVKRIITLSTEGDDADIQTMNRFLGLFEETNKVHFRVASQSYLGLSILIVDNRSALLCFPDDSGRSIGYGMCLSQSQIVTSLQWLFRRVESCSKVILAPYQPKATAVQIDELAPSGCQAAAPQRSMAMDMATIAKPDAGFQGPRYHSVVEYLPNNRVYMETVREQLAAVTKSCWLLRSNKTDGEPDKVIVSEFLEKARNLCQKLPQQQNSTLSFQRVVFRMNEQNLNPELARCQLALDQQVNALLGVIEHQIDTLNISIMDFNCVILGFHDDNSTHVLWGLKITEPALVRGVINAYLHLQNNVDENLLDVPTVKVSS